MAPGAIVVGTDGSETADRAVMRAGELAEALGSTLHVISAFNPSTGNGWLAAAGGIATAELALDVHVREQAEATVERAVALVGQGVEVVGHVSDGDPADALIALAESEQAHMIVVGNRGMRGARRVIGSVPNSVSHRAACSVLIVPTDA